MARCAKIVVLGYLLGFGSTTQASPWTFHWQKGQVLTYQVEHITKVTELVAGNKVEMVSKLKVLKNWQIESINNKGTATVHLTLASMHNEQTRPNGKVLLDSDHPDKGTPELHKQLKKFIGNTLAELHVDQQGKVAEVVQGAKVQFETDLPFAVCLPATDMSEGRTWARSFQIVLDPPFGAGEKFTASQQYQVVKLTDNQATLRVNTAIKDMPKSPAEQLPLLQKQPQGEVIFDLVAGRMLSADLKIECELQGHQGTGSNYRFYSRHLEKLVNEPSFTLMTISLAVTLPVQMPFRPNRSPVSLLTKLTASRCIPGSTALTSREGDPPAG